MNKIGKVTPQEGYILELLFTDGHKVLLNLGTKLYTIRFGLLSDKEFFNRVTTDGYYIRWDNKIEIAVSEVFELIEYSS